MIDAKKQLTSALEAILPTYYEYALGDDITLPCITYIESGNNAREEGDNIRYSTVRMTIKLYSYDMGDIANYSSRIDDTLFDLGYTRTASNEIIVNKQIVKILNYEARGLEER